MKEYHYLLKMIVIGDAGVGKTCLLHRLQNSTYTEATPTTIGIEFFRKEIEINSKKIILQVWDTVGQENMHR